MRALGLLLLSDLAERRGLGLVGVGGCLRVLLLGSPLQPGDLRCGCLQGRLRVIRGRGDLQPRADGILRPVLYILD